MKKYISLLFSSSFGKKKEMINSNEDYNILYDENGEELDNDNNNENQLNQNLITNKKSFSLKTSENMTISDPNKINNNILKKRGKYKFEMQQGKCK